MLFQFAGSQDRWRRVLRMLAWLLGCSIRNVWKHADSQVSVRCKIRIHQSHQSKKNVGVSDHKQKQEKWLSNGMISIKTRDIP